jgi:murein DD-endopeptidase MepM/ murein hydrolase activator NlpD
VLFVAAAALAVFFLATRPARSTVNGTPAIVTLTSAPTGASEFEIPPHTPTATATPEPPVPTSTYLPPSPSPSPITTPASTQFYTTRSGDTLPALAARFGVNPADIAALSPEGDLRQELNGTTTLAEGQLLIIPRVLEAVGPGYLITPDSELVFSASGAGFDAQKFAEAQGGYLAAYDGFADQRSLAGGDLLHVIAEHHSINPRLLMALLEYQSGWVTNPQPAGDALIYPMGYVHQYRHNLYSQLNWAARQLATGYYGWRAGTLTELQFADGATLRLDPALNAGTAALQFYFAQTRTRPQWEEAVGPDGFAAAYRRFFGDPFERAVMLIPADLTQPPLELPFQPGHTWYFSGGPHGAWQPGGALAALDFAPASFEGGCAESREWVTAAAAGQIVRANDGSVLLDLDGDGREETGWVVFYMHIAEKDRVKPGAVVEAGDRIGHPSCEGGTSTGTHVHIARKYNGEWIPADGLVPFDLSGWVASNGRGEYFGSLARDGRTIESCTCTSAAQAITADP